MHLMRHFMLCNRALKSIRYLHTFVVNVRIKPDNLALLPGCLHILKLFMNDLITKNRQQ